MKVEKPFPLPENEPVVPDKLAEFVTTYLQGTTKIQVLVYAKSGWSKANEMLLEDADEASEVYSMVKMCADHHCDEHGGETRKYRALIWRDVGEEKLQRRTLTFEVVPERVDDEVGEPPHMEAIRNQTEIWQSMCEEMRKMTAMAIDFGNRSVDRVLEQARQDSERLKPMTELTREMLSHYREGLRMQATAVKEVGEMRVQQEIARAETKDDKFWDVMGPAVQVAMMQAQQRFLGGPKRAKALPSATAGAGSVERREHRPPTSPAAEAPVSMGPGGGAAEVAEAAEAAVGQMPDSLLGLSQMVLDNLGARSMLRLSRALDDEQAGFLEQLSGAENDDMAAQAIVGLTDSLTGNAEGLLKMQELLTVPQITVFRQLAELAVRHLGAQARETRQIDSSASSKALSSPI